MALNPSVIFAGTTSLRSYENAGVHRHSHPVENYQPLSYTGATPANTPINFVIPVYLQLLSLLIGSTQSNLQNATVSFAIKDVNNITSSLIVPIPDINPANGAIAFIDFPFMILNPGATLTISASFATNYFNLWTKEVFVDSAILGQR